MKICFIYDGEYPWDIRVEKICDTLISAGNDVYLVCRNYRAESLSERTNSFEINRMPFLSSKTIFLNKLINFPLFFSPFWILRSFQVARGQKCQLIIVRDLPLALTAILVGKIISIPVVMDMAEVYPEALRSNWMFDKKKMRGINHLIRSPYLAEKIEKLVVRLINHIFVVSQESKNRLQQLYSCSKDKVSVVGNTPELSKFYAQQPSFPGSLSMLKTKKIILFSGFILGDRGLSLAIKAMPTILVQVPNAHLVIVGEGIGKENLEKLVKGMGLREKITFEGWVDNPIISKYAASSTIGILPFSLCKHTQITLANKLFDYMAVGLPVVASNLRPMLRIIEEERCGILFKANDQHDYEIKVTNLLKDKNLRQRLSKNGIRASLTKYNWANEAKTVNRIVEQLDAHQGSYS